MVQVQTTVPPGLQVLRSGELLGLDRAPALAGGRGAGWPPRPAEQGLH